MNKEKLLNKALILAVFTVFYNIAEGLVSVFFGAAGESLTLFGFGLDSFIEVLSGLGIWHMIIRMKKSNTEEMDKFEKRALTITGLSFYILSAGLLLTVVYNTWKGNKPSTTFWGIVISVVSIVSMLVLWILKKNTGKKLNSAAVLADADCTKTCLYLSVILLLSGLFYQIFKTGYIDSIGALGIAYFSFTEGKESFEKAKGKD